MKWAPTSCMGLFVVGERTMVRRKRELWVSCLDSLALINNKTSSGRCSQSWQEATWSQEHWHWRSKIKAIQRWWMYCSFLIVATVWITRPTTSFVTKLTTKSWRWRQTVIVDKDNCSIGRKEHFTLGQNCQYGVLVTKFLCYLVSI